MGAIDLCVEEHYRRPTSRWKRFWVGTQFVKLTGPWTEDFRLVPFRSTLPVDGHFHIDAWEGFFQSLEPVPDPSVGGAPDGELVTKFVEDVPVLTVMGPFGWNHTYGLQDVITEKVEQGHLGFVIDLRKSKGFDMTAMSQLAHSYKTAADADGIVVIVDSAKRRARFWDPYIFGEIFSVYPSIEDAVGAVKHETLQT